MAGMLGDIIHLIFNSVGADRQRPGSESKVLQLGVVGW